MNSPEPTVSKVRRGPVRLLWGLAGVLCVVIGSIGVVVPGLPTTIFFIGAAAAFSRSSERLEAWVLGLPKIGPAIRDHRAGLGMPRRAKVLAIGMIVVAVTISALLVGPWWLRVTIVVAGLIGVGAVMRVPTKVSDTPPDPNDPASVQNAEQ
ncbi:MAG: YbaN family protein [Actinomycetota bacterium]